MSLKLKLQMCIGAFMSKSNVSISIIINPLKTSPEYTWAGTYGKCVL